MTDASSTHHSGSCASPDIAQLLGAYCFSRATEEERRAVETHVLECESCWQEVRRMEVAMKALKADRNLLHTLSPADVAAAMGISSKLQSLFAGHLWHVLTGCFLYASLFVITLFLEVAYQYDFYRRIAIRLAPVIFCWMFISSAAAFAADWKMSSRGRTNGLMLSSLIHLGAIALLFGGILLWLPPVPITELQTQAYTAQGAYLKDSCYSLILVLLFFAAPFHFIVSMQRELQMGRYKLALGLLSGKEPSLSPRGAVYIRFSILVGALMAMAILSVYLTTNLLNHLQPSPYMNLFTNLIFLRLIVFYTLGVICLVWYSRSLDELKRECLIAESIRTS